MMLTPCWPKDGPTGGAGLAEPAGKFNFSITLIFLAIFIYRESTQMVLSEYRKYANSLIRIHSLLDSYLFAIISSQPAKSPVPPVFLYQR